MKGFVVLVLLFLLLCNLNSDSQSRDSLLNIYNLQTIYRSGNKFMKGNDKLSLQNLKSEFNSPITTELYRKSKNRSTVSKIFNLGSLAVIIVSAFTPTNTKGNIEFIAASSLLGAGGIYYHIQSSRYLDKAIWIRNGEVLDSHH